MTLLQVLRLSISKGISCGNILWFLGFLFILFLDFNTLYMFEQMRK